LLNETVKSPITDSPAKLLMELNTGTIKKAYMDELSLDVGEYFPSDQKVCIYSCPDTGYKFYYPFTIFADAGFYNLLHKANKSYYEPWKWENEQAARYLKPDDFLLDVGCGEGLFLKEMNKRGMKHLYGIDFASETKNDNDLNDINIENITIENFSLQHNGKFDVITCFQVLEHITEVKSFIENCLNCLKKNGKLIIAVPNNHPYIYKNDLYHTLNLPPHHAGLWNKESLTKICNYFPLELIETQFQPIGEQLDYYIQVQIAYYINQGNHSKSIFSLSLFRNIYSKILHMFKNSLQGHTILAVYRKR
jgi:SAM-dependent methyltransferase